MKSLTRLFKRAGRRVQAWNELRARARADERLWRLALKDARILADVHRAMSAQAVQNRSAAA